MASGDPEGVQKRLECVKHAPQSLFPPKKQPGLRAESKIRISVNVWGIYPSENVPFYRYDFRVTEEYPAKEKGAKPVVKEVTKQIMNDFSSLDRKNKCVIVYKKLLEQERGFFGDISSFVYDRASILYSLDKLSIGPEEVKTFYIAGRDLPAEFFSEDCVRVVVNIKQCDEDFVLTAKDLKSALNENPDLINKSIKQFYELLLSQEAFFIEGRFVCYGSNECYLLHPERYGFIEKDIPNLPEGKYVGVGVSKGVKIVEGAGNEPTLSVNIDVKKAAFHVDHQGLVEKVAEICNSRDLWFMVDKRQIILLNKMLKGLFVRCTYGKLRSFSINGIANESAEKMRLQKEGKMINLIQYFKERYNKRLKYSHLPLVVEKTPKGLNYYPMELLQVCENQRVTLTQQSLTQVQQVIRASAVPPFIRMRQTKVLTKALMLHDSGLQNRWVKEFQLKLSEQNIEMDARILRKPDVVYGGDGVAQMKDTTSWSLSLNTKYLLPAGCERWYGFALVSSNDRFDKHMMGTYVDSFVKRCRQRGMTMNGPLEVLCICRAREEDIKSCFDKARANNATFIHFVTSENLKFHEKMKYFESQYQILTQDLLTKTAIAVKQRSQLLDNIVHKTNLKLGGLNFNIRLESDKVQGWISRGDRLVIGIDLTFAVPPKGQKSVLLPSVIGYSSNCHAHPLDFIGGYRYLWSNKEQLCEGETAILDLMVESLRLVKKNRQAPNHLLILRDGISEGQYKYVLENEVEQVKKACGVVGGAKYRPHITFIVSTKKHNLRMYIKASAQNVPPGTVIDYRIVDPVLNEFYLKSHTALQGTAKPPRYNLLYDTSKMTLDEIQGVVFALSFNLQIVNQACSLPAPIMIADQMASRGRSNFSVLCAGGFNEKMEYNLDSLNLELGYMGKPLGNCRFNA